MSRVDNSFGPGACCIPDSGECTDDVGFFQCSAAGGVWSAGFACADIDCPPIIPVGACCDVAAEVCTPDLTLEDEILPLVQNNGI